MTEIDKKTFWVAASIIALGASIIAFAALFGSDAVDCGCGGIQRQIAQ